MNGPIVLAAGGTGGHLFPAQALASELSQRGHRLVLVTDRRVGAFDEGLATLETHTIHAGTFRGRGLVKRLWGVVGIIVGLFEARFLLGRLAPAGAVGFGGYPSLPTMFGASGMGVPTVIHEQNAVLGQVNRLMAGRVSAIATSFATTQRVKQPTRVTHTGNPVRPAIAALSEAPYTAPEPGGPVRLLVFGGSQGSQIFSRVVPDALSALPEALRARLSVSQQCRPEDLEGVRAHYGEAGIEASLSSFFEDMAERLGGAHLVICRAGASTIAELSAVARPAILVPYPLAVDDHQRANAAALADAGGAWLMDQDGFTPPNLAARLEGLLTEPGTLASAAENARRLGRPDAAHRLADLVERVTGTNGRRTPTLPQEDAA